MSSAETVSYELIYGHDQSIVCSAETARLTGMHFPPASISNIPLRLNDVLSEPLDAPPLNQSIVDTDRLILVVDSDTPAVADIVAGLVEHIMLAGLTPEQVTVLQSNAGTSEPSDPRRLLRDDFRSEVKWTIHDPAEESNCAYLASTGSGERIYLARDLIDADVVITVGPSAFDPLLGYRGTFSAIYPGLSNIDAVRRVQGQGHTELSPENDRPLRRMIDEIGWLLGSLFTVQVMPSTGGNVASILAGSVESVQRAAQRDLSERWRLRLTERADTVVLSIDADASGHDWNQLGSALATARNLVMQGGRIVVLSELDCPAGPGQQMLSSALEPADVIKPLRLEKPSDVVAATELAQAVDWATVFLMSRLDPEFVEELFMVPITEASEVQSLIDRSESCILLQSAQNCYGEIVD